MLSLGEVKFIRQGLSRGIRLDGRSNEQFRRRLESTKTLKNTPGSASVVIEGSSVLVAIQARVTSPVDTGNCGILDISVDL